MAEILIPENFREHARAAPNHWDVHFVSVRLKDGRIFRKLAAREGVCITGRVSSSGVVNPLPFKAEDIADLEAHYPTLHNALTFVAWLLGRIIHIFRPSSAVPFSSISWAPWRRF
jgi:hypothetical protein